MPPGDPIGRAVHRRAELCGGVAHGFGGGGASAVRARRGVCVLVNAYYSV